MTVSQSSPSAADAENRRRILSGYLLLVLAVLVWAGNSIVGRSAGDAAIPPLGFNFWRWATAFLIFAVFFGVKTWRQRREILAHWKFVTGFSVVSIAGFNSVFYIALQKSTALQVALIQSILPVLVLLLGLVILRQRISPRQWWGIVFSIAGAVLIVVRGDIREELDRLVAHVAAARDLMAEGGAVGRRLDFLCQEFNREANTLCSKSTDLELTRIGLALKAAIERLREQIQNIE